LGEVLVDAGLGKGWGRNWEISFIPISLDGHPAFANPTVALCAAINCPSLRMALSRIILASIMSFLFFEMREPGKPCSRFRKCPCGEVFDMHGPDAVFVRVPHITAAERGQGRGS
jgi:hypothetical protein